MSTELQTWLRSLPFRFRRDFAVRFQQKVEQFAGELREDAPEGPTGRTKRSVRVTRGRHSLELNVEAGGPTTTVPVRKGVDAEYDYANAREFGTSRQSAEPWFYPGYRRRRERWNQEVQELAASTIVEANS